MNSVPLADRIEEWRSQLLDTTKTNRLIKLEFGRSGAIKLVHPEEAEDIWRQLVDEGASMSFPFKRSLVGQAEARVVDESEPTSENVSMDACLASPRLRPGHLLTELTDKDLGSRLGRLDLNARTSISEQGVPILYVGFGLLKWYESPDDTVEILSPLLLLPVELSRENIDSPWQLKLLEDEPVPNFSLAQWMSHDFKIQFPELPQNGEESDQADLRPRYFADIRHAVRHQKRWEIQDQCVLGIFAFQKIAMWEDLGQNRDQILAHDLCRAIAGDSTVEWKFPSDLPGAKHLDDAVRPIDTYHILDADSSQQEAIEAAKRGASLVLDGPPGTGKSQTIANIIAEFLAAGKTVLFVSEKSAALEVVKRRLDERKLGDFCLECHSHKANKKQVIDELGRCLKLHPERYKDHSEDLNRLFEDRKALNAYVQALHERRPPLGISAFDAHARLAALPKGAATLCPIPNEVIESITRDELDRIEGLLARLPDYRDAIRDHAAHPWRGSNPQANTVNLKADLDAHLKNLDDGLRLVRNAAAMLTRLDLAPAEMSFPEWRDLTAMIAESEGFSVVPADWFDRGARRVAKGYIELDEQTRAYRQARQALPEFDEEKLLALDKNVLESLASVGSETGLRLRSGDHATVRGLSSLLEQIRAPLQTAIDRGQAVAAALDEILAALGIPPRPIAAKGVGKVHELFGLAESVAPARPSWLDPNRRQELQEVVGRCREEEALNAECRIGLIDRLRPAAFEPASADLIRRSLAFRAGWKRSLPAWWRLRGSLAAMYAGAAPLVPQLLDDMATLAEYHRRHGYVAQMKQEYRDHLPDGEDTGAAWERLDEKLQSCAKLDPLLKLYPALKEVMQSAEGFDKPGYHDTRQRLSERYNEFKEALKALDSHIDVQALMESGDKEGRISLDQFVKRLQQQAAALDPLSALPETAAALLRPDRDLDLEELPSRIDHIEPLRAAHERIETLARALKLDEEPRQAREHDWADMREKAEWVIAFLDQHSDAPPAPLVRIASHPEIREEVIRAIEANRQAHTGSLKAGWEFLSGIFDCEQHVSTGIRLNGCSLESLHNWVRGRQSDTHRFVEWARFQSLCERIDKEGYPQLVSELLDGRIAPEVARDAFLARFYGNWLGWVAHRNEPDLVSTEDHVRRVKRFRDLDRDAVRLAKTRIRQIRLNDPDRPVESSLAPSSSELGILLREVNKKTRHLPLRKLFAQIPTVLPRLKPCLMMSPLAVSTYLNAPEIRFDLVIFDEASQVRPFDAISAIYRGRQLIVAGDQKQLPPTSFFERGLSDDSDADEDENEAVLTDYESVLDVCCAKGLPRRRLRWHYRSRREALIAFSNHYIYDNELVTFPSADDTPENPAVRFEYLPNARWKSGKSGGFNAKEASRVADLVMRHFRTHPEWSLGVIAFNERQQRAILDELEKRRRADSSLEDYFSQDRADPFFVKNLETVQGDERDVIFLSVGYGPNETDGRVAMRFGPLNQQGGERRLNVAITRAKQAMTVISSLKSQDIDLSRTEAVGVKLLRGYLDFAERGTVALGAEITAVGERDYDSPFEEQVASALRQRGLEVRSQVGCGGFRIDLALVDPNRPGRFVLGIECDGATYHSSATARDRDRLRQEVLENLGWTITRIWSTDWVKDPDAQIRRVEEAYRRQLDADSSENRASPSGQAAEPPRDEQPTVIIGNGYSEPVGSTPYYANISEVPDSKIDAIILASPKFGRADQAEVITLVARQLGFQRTGAKIKDRIDGRVSTLVRDDQITRTETDAATFILQLSDSFLRS